MAITNNSRLAGSTVYVAGHRSFAGSAIMRRLQREHCVRGVGITRAELDLAYQAAVHRFFEEEHPDFVFLAAARVGGILGNKTRPAQFIPENLAIQTSVILAAHRFGVKRVLFLGSCCIYPRDCPQQIKEEYLLTGPLEGPTALRRCQDYRH